MGLRKRFWTPFFGQPSGLVGQVGARLMASMKGKYYRAMAAELELRADDEMLDVGCGSGKSFAEHARHVRYVAGLDASGIQVETVRKRLSECIAAGTAEIVAGDAAKRLVEEAGFVDVALSVLPVAYKSRLVHATKPTGAGVDEATEPTAPG